MGTDAPVELPTAAIIKDVDQLKANLKEEKRARAEAEVEVTEPQQPSGQADVTQQDSTDPSAPESERRKRRRVDSEAEVVTEILDGPLPIPVTTESKPAEETQSGVIDVVKLAQELLDGEHSSGKDVDVVSSDADKVEATAPVASVETATQPAKGTYRSSHTSSQLSQKLPRAYQFLAAPYHYLLVVSEADKDQDEPVSNEVNL